MTRPDNIEPSEASCQQGFPCDDPSLCPDPTGCDHQPNAEAGSLPMTPNPKDAERLAYVTRGFAETTASMTEWQTIETAPKDGGPILSWDGNVMVVVIYCGCKRQWFLVENKDYAAHPESPIDWEGLTHWMPLPEPPIELRDAERPADFVPSTDPGATIRLLQRSIVSQSDLIKRLTQERDEARRSAEALQPQVGELLALPDDDRGHLWRHKVRGTTYRILGIGRVQCPHDKPLEDDEFPLVYQDIETGALGIRRSPEFHDGRFERVVEIEPAAKALSLADKHEIGMAAAFKRICIVCGRREWLFSRRFPAIGEPALSWKSMGTAPPERLAAIRAREGEE